METINYIGATLVITPFMIATLALLCFGLYEAWNYNKKEAMILFGIIAYFIFGFYLMAY